MDDTLYIVVPCYNEEEVLPETAKRLKSKLNAMIKDGAVSEDSKILFVDDGSNDKTWSIIEDLHKDDPVFTGIKLSRNRGHQNALFAGLMAAKEQCGYAISVDADLQDDIEVLDKFAEEYKKGAEIVYGVRKSRDTDTAFKRGSAQSFYKLLDAMGVEVVYNHADYRLMSKKALDALSEYGEVNLFLRGIIPQLGYKTAKVEYDRHERFAGESKYPLSKMLNLAADGITSFSVKPIRMITTVGIILFVCSVVFLIWSLIFNQTYLTLASVWLLGSLQLTAIGIVGSYVGKTYMETKKRPRYFIEKTLID